MLVTTRLLVNGRIYSSFAPDATSIAITDGIVVWVGDERAGRALHLPREIEDLGQAFVTPGSSTPTSTSPHWDSISSASISWARTLWTNVSREYEHSQPRTPKLPIPTQSSGDTVGTTPSGPSRPRRRPQISTRPWPQGVSLADRRSLGRVLERIARRDLRPRRHRWILSRRPVDVRRTPPGAQCRSESADGNSARVCSYRCARSLRPRRGPWPFTSAGTGHLGIDRFPGTVGPRSRRGGSGLLG